MEAENHIQQEQKTLKPALGSQEKKVSKKSSKPLKNNRPEASIQRKLQEIANNNPRAEALESLKSMASSKASIQMAKDKDMSPSLSDMDSINAIDKKASDKAMDVTKEEFLTKQMGDLADLVSTYSMLMNEICTEGISLKQLNDRLTKLVATGIAISALGIGLTIATGGAAAPIALIIGLSTALPGLGITLGKSVTKKARDKKVKALGAKADSRTKDNAKDGLEVSAGVAASSTEATADFGKFAAESTLNAVEAGAEIAGMSVAGISILVGVNDIYQAQQISLAKILKPKFFNEQMLILESLRSKMNELDSKGGKFPIKSQLSPHIDSIQSSIERVGDM